MTQRTLPANELAIKACDGLAARLASSSTSMVTGTRGSNCRWKLGHEDLVLPSPGGGQRHQGHAARPLAGRYDLPKRANAREQSSSRSLAARTHGTSAPRRCRKPALRSTRLLPSGLDSARDKRARGQDELRYAMNIRGGHRLVFGKWKGRTHKTGIGHLPIAEITRTFPSNSASSLRRAWSSTVTGMPGSRWSSPGAPGQYSLARVFRCMNARRMVSPSPTRSGSIGTWRASLLVEGD
jgi:hypothetical protein